jgi:hypothetical protein
MVGARGFEPPTPDTPCQCATRLRYAPIKILQIIPEKSVKMVFC